MIYDLKEVTPVWLSQVLHEPVISCTSRGNSAFNSNIAHLVLTYAPSASPTAPERLLVKLNDNENGEVEVGFYRLVNSLATTGLPMLVHCFDAAYEPASGNSYCLLEDLSETHYTPVTREQVLGGLGVPTNVELYRMIDAIVGFHAYWWQHAQLGSSEITAVRWWYRNQEFFEKHIERREKELKQFLAAVGSDFPADLRILYEQTLAHFPKLWNGYLRDRVTTHHNMTMSNGDCYFAQFLCPNKPGGRAHLVDFQDASANFGPYDLVYMLATFWSSAQRQATNREKRLLQRYHQGLRVNGVTDYSWDDCLRDYKMMIVFMIFDPIWNQVSGSSTAYWQPKLRCLTDAFKDLNCAEMLAEI